MHHLRLGLGHLTCILILLRLRCMEGNLDQWWSQVSTSYPSYENTTQILKEIEAAYSHLLKVYSVGKSAQDREMWVVNLRKNVTEERKLLQPPMKIIANMHGDETVGRALVLMLAVDLVKSVQQNNPRIVQLMESTDIHLMPSANPDGFEAAKEGECSPDPQNTGRRNANRVDLNRNFPDQFTSRKKNKENIEEGREPETLNLMRFITTNDFVLSANLHGGALVASYPFDSVPVSIEKHGYDGTGVRSLSPDNDFFVYLSKLYANNHRTMTQSQSQENCPADKFVNGITNGAYWYNVRGGMQDFNYVHSNCYELTVELSCCKFPLASTLLTEWDNNKESLYKFIETTHLGIRGIVSQQNGTPVQGAEIEIEGIDHTVQTNKRGEYWRLLVPGKYKVGVKANGFESTNLVPVEVGELDLSSPTVLDFTMTPSSAGPEGLAAAEAAAPVSTKIANFLLCTTVLSLYISQNVEFAK